jgi:hypothetical protein
MNAYALLQRKDMVELMGSLQAKEKGRGMLINDVDTGQFRSKLEKSGFYDEWRKIIGSEAWTLYEKAISAK